MTDEVKASKEETLAELKRKIKELESEVAAKDETIDSMKKKEEGWLVWTANPMYNGVTAGILFTDGMTFIPKDRVISQYVVQLPTDVQQKAMLTDTARFPNGKEELETIKQSAKMPSSERCVLILTNDFGYRAEFFTKDQMDELQKRISNRAQERKEMQDRLGTQADMLEKLLAAHHF